MSKFLPSIIAGVYCLAVIAPVSAAALASPTTAENAPTITPAKTISASVKDFNKPRLKNYNPDFLSYFAAEEPFVDVLRTRAFDTFYRKTPLADLISAGHIDIEKEQINSLPNGATFNLGFLKYATKWNATKDYYQNEWFVTWEGDARITINSQNKDYVARVVSPGKMKVTFGPSHDTSAIVQLRSVNGSFKNWRAYEAKYDGTDRVYRDEFLNYIAPYDFIRLLNWNRTNSSAVTRASQLCKDGVRVWANVYAPDTGTCHGMPIADQVRLVQKTGQALWLNIPNRLGAPAALEIDPPRIKGTTTFSRWVDKAEPYVSEILESNAHYDYALYLIDELTRLNYGSEKPIYIEVGNEVWNTKMADTAGIHQAIGERYGKNRMFGYGLRVGSFADAFARALKERGVSLNYTVIVNGFGTSTTKAMLDGIDQYMADNGVMLDKSLIGVASTNYFFGGFKYEKLNPYGAQSAEEFNAALKADLLKDREAAFKRLTDYIIAGPYHGSVIGVMRKIDGIANVTTQWGGRYVGNYEGDSHIVLNKRKTDPVIMEASIAWHISEHRARVIRTMKDMFFAKYPNAQISNFQGWRDEVTTSPWADGRPGSTNPVIEAWAED